MNLRKGQLISFMGLFLFSAFSFAFAQYQIPTTVVPDPTSVRSFLGCNLTGQSFNLSDCLMNILGYLLSILTVVAFALAVIFILWAGILYIATPDKKDEAKNRIIYAVIGLVVAFLSFALARLIGAVVNQQPQQ